MIPEPGLIYLGMNNENAKTKQGIIFNTVNWLHSNTSIQMYTQR